MDNEQKTPSAETLRQLPYSALKKIAKQRGIKGNLKAEKLIAALTSIAMDSDDTDSFSTPAAKVVNSSQKKKIEKFDQDSMTPLITPRRGTYSIGSPITLKQSETPSSSVMNESSLSMSNLTVEKELERKLRSSKQHETSLYSVTDEHSLLDMSNITVGRGSERKTRSRKKNETSAYSVTDELSPLDISNVTTSNINESSVLDISNVTVGRGSERKPRNRKVSFLSPVMTPRTPKNSNLKMRPKTPIVSRTSLVTIISPSPMKELKVNLGERVDKSMHLTSLTEKISDEPDIESTSFITSDEVSVKEEESDEVSVTEKQNDISKSASLLVNNEVSAKKKSLSTPKLTRSLMNKSELSKKKRLATPNFKKIHEKAFEKMESIEDYQKRVMSSAKKMGILKTNKVTKAKTKIPAFGGIPFIPSVSRSASTKWNTSVKKNEQIEEKKKTKNNDVENINHEAKQNKQGKTRSKTKFDLKASLSRKLGYKPYTGPLKPLTPSNVLNTSSAACDHKYKNTPAKEPVNKVVTSNRMQSRSVLKGVRTNKRFELQMKNRMLQ